MSEAEFEGRVASALQASPVGGAGARRAIMDRVRALPAHERPVRRARTIIGRRAVRHSIVGVALAAGIGSLGTISSLVGGADAGGRGSLATAVIGDTVSATLHDTLRLVRLIFDDTAARRVAAVGDFNAWRADRTPLVRDPATRRWTATVALRDGEHRYAFVVDNTRWVLDPAAPHGRGADGRLHSLLHVAALPN
ncbi:MAG: hypothetical protein JWN79_3108 [Gemmatimonadetes bacterium]|jgi:hypothetical protein|nr:hypothetical protein [Gemmatimonadota bacterium]